MILIRPTARPTRQEPAKAPPSLVPEGPVGMVQGSGVIPAGSQAIGRNPEPAAPAEAPAAPAEDDDEAPQEPPPAG